MVESLEMRVRKRAGHRCEYCKMPAFVSGLTFPLDHIVAQQHGGETTFENLALSCPHCNYHKGPNLAGIDPETKMLTQQFHPRRHRWASHFHWDGPTILGKTAIGRTTLYVLTMNHHDRVEARRLLIEAGLFPTP